VAWNTFRLACAITLATLCLCVPTTVARAGEQWCEDDPLIVVQTPEGALVPVYVTNGARGVENLPFVLLTSVTYSVKKLGRGTVVDMAVTVPNDPLSPPFETRSTVSTGPLKTGVVLATASGYSQETMHMRFTLDVP
jgi:hypothetical protein